MTIKQDRPGMVCYSEFYFDKLPYRFAFNGKKGMPLITEKKKAREYEFEIKRKLRMGTFIAESPLKNFGKFYSEFFVKHSKKHKSELATRFDEYYSVSLLEAFGDRNFDQISAGMIEDYLSELSQQTTKYNRVISPVTVRMHYERLNRIFNLAIREKVTLDNPCRLVEKKLLKQFPSWQPRDRWLNKYSPDEEGKLFDELSPPLQIICRILLNTGLRPPQEVLGIEKEHVNLGSEARYYKFKGQDVLIPPGGLFVAKGKAGKTRTIPLNSTARKIMEVLCSDASTGRFLFLNREGQPLGSIKKGWQMACERAGIDDLRPYDLRHTFATRLVERGVHEYIISALLGHSMPVAGFGHASRITPGYAHATWEAMQKAVESLEHLPANSTVFQTHSGKSQEKSAQNGRVKGKVKAG